MTLRFMKFMLLFFYIINIQTPSYRAKYVRNVTLFFYAAAAAAAKSRQSCPTLCDLDGSPPGFPAPGILQARILEWVAISFSNA